MTPVTAKTQPLLEARGVVRRFGNTLALDGVDLALDGGELLGLVGPDGAGKTTLLRALVAVIEIDGGAVLVDGLRWGEAGAEAREHIGYMPQAYGLYTDLTVDENLRFFARLFDLDRREFAERRARLLALTRLEKAHDRRAGALSGGMYKKLAIACALLHRPRALILDEPTNGVDPVSRRELWVLLHELVAEGIGVLVSTPAMDEAERCTRVVLLHHGRVLAAGAPDRLVERFDGVVLLARPATAGPRALDELEGHIRAAPGVLATNPAGDRLRLVVQRDAAEPVIAGLRAAGATPTTGAPDFEDLYLSLTSGARGRPS